MTVNLVAVDFESSKTTLMKDGDLLTNKVHRHEPPIRMELPEIAFEDDKYFVGKCLNIQCQNLKKNAVELYF